MVKDYKQQRDKSDVICLDLCKSFGTYFHLSHRPEGKLTLETYPCNFSLLFKRRKSTRNQYQ